MGWKWTWNAIDPVVEKMLTKEEIDVLMQWGRYTKDKYIGFTCPLDEACPENAAGLQVDDAQLSELLCNAIRKVCPTFPLPTFPQPILDNKEE